MVGATRQILFPGPLVLEGHQLVHVGIGVDDALVLGPHAGVAAFCAGAGGKGSRFPIPVTRAVVAAITNGSLEGCATEHLETLNLDIPVAINGVDSKYINPRNAWDDKAAYDQQATKLAQLFVKNITKFEPSADIIAAGPKV